MGALKVIVESPPTLTLKIPSVVTPLLEVNGTVKVAAVACRVADKVSIGSTVKMQPVPVVVRATEVSLVASTLVASPQVRV